MVLRKTKFNNPDYSYIPGGLHVGANILVRGRVPEGSDGFSINLQKENNDGCDIAFHFNPRLALKTVVRNTYHGGWQGEERDTPSFPFTSGSKFTLRINVGPNAYDIMVNGQFFIQYKHRLPHQEVNFMRLNEHAEYYEATIQNTSHLPYRGEIPGGLKPGKAIRVRGCVNDNANRFEINFNTDPDGHTVGVLFNPRQDEEAVVLNTKVGDWQAEERGKESFPFKRGHFYDILFIAWDGLFNIYVNESFYTSYKFRVAADDIKFISINGDTTLLDVEFDKPLPTDYIKAIPSGLEQSDLVITKGFFYPEGKRFAVNLHYGTSVNDDIALHFNPRRDQGEVVLNNRQNGGWGAEERHKLPNPFTELLPFEVEFVNKSNKFKIYVNGKQFADFQARGKVEDIKSINVGGEAHFYEVKLLRRVENPFVDNIPGKFQQGTWVTVCGTPKKDANEFDINLQCGDDSNYSCDVAFHFNIRFKKQKALTKDLKDGDWGKKHKEKSHFPFVAEDKFEVNILLTSDVFKVYVNGKYYTSFSYRIKPDHISHIMLKGDCNFFEPEFYNLQFTA